jgi:hypothetical protein
MLFFKGMRHCIGLVLALLCRVVNPLSAEPAPGWTRQDWNGEPAWSSTHRGAKAIVSETRARLIYFGPEDGSHNLLSAPTPLLRPSATESAPNWGGHRFWLGPQSRWKWPPVSDWEFAAAARVETTGAALVLTHSQTDKRYPALQREYAWEQERLRCTVRWQHTGAPFYGMHVFAIEVPASIDVRLAKWDRVPHGIVGINGDSPNATNPLPHAAATVENDKVRLRSGLATGKFGFFPQILQVARGAHTLRVHPGVNQGIEIEAPDFGYLTQVWVGPEKATFAEMEQITPYLLSGDKGGWCASTVYLEME